MQSLDSVLTQPTTGAVAVGVETHLAGDAEQSNWLGAPDAVDVSVVWRHTIAQHERCVSSSGILL